MLPVNLEGYLLYRYVCVCVCAYVCLCMHMCLHRKLFMRVYLHTKATRWRQFAWGWKRFFDCAGMCVWMWLCVCLCTSVCMGNYSCEHTCPQRPQDGDRPPGARVSGSYESLLMVLETLPIFCAFFRKHSRWLMKIIYLFFKYRIICKHDCVEPFACECNYPHRPQEFNWLPRCFENIVSIICVIIRKIFTMNMENYILGF